MGSHTHNKESTLFINHKMVSSFLKNRTENFGKWGESIKTEHTFFFDLQGLHLTHAEKLLFWRWNIWSYFRNSCNYSKSVLSCCKCSSRFCFFKKKLRKQICTSDVLKKQIAYTFWTLFDMKDIVGENYEKLAGILKKLRKTTFSMKDNNIKPSHANSKCTFSSLNEMVLPISLHNGSFSYQVWVLNKSLDLTKCLV